MNMAKKNLKYIQKILSMVMYMQKNILKSKIIYAI